MQKLSQKISKKCLKIKAKLRKGFKRKKRIIFNNHNLKKAGAELGQAQFKLDDIFDVVVKAVVKVEV